MDKSGRIIGSILLGATLFYLLLPNLLFLLGWVQWYWAIPLFLLLLVSFWRIVRCTKGPDVRFERADAWILPLLMLGAALCTECLGLHGHVPQAWDFEVRNPIYETLVRCDWPIYNAEGGYFVYYMAYWLPPALLSKVAGDVLSPITILWIWNYIGVLLLLLTLWMRLKKRVVVVLVLLQLLGSLNDLRRIYGFAKWAWEQCPVLECIDPYVYVLTDWTNYFFLGLWNQIAVNTPHTALSVCIVMALILSKRFVWQHIPFISALAVVWSPLASVCMLPWIMLSMRGQSGSYIAFAQLWRRLSVWSAVGLLLVVAAYFSCMESGMIHFVWSESVFYNDWMKSRSVRLLKACFIALLMYAPMCLFLWKKYKRTSAFWVCSILIWILPFVWVGYENNELLFKGSAVVMFFLVILYGSRLVHARGLCRWVLVAYIALSAGEFFWDVGFRVVHKYSLNHQVISEHIRDEWVGHLNHPQHLAYKNFFGKNTSSCLLYTQSGISAEHVLKPFATGQTGANSNPERRK